MRRLTCLLLVVFAAGCGAAGPNARSAKDKDKGVALEAPAGGEARKPEVKKADAADKQLPRKIIYTGQMELIVEDFDEAEQQLLDLLKEHEAYIARSERRGRPGDPRSGDWTLRVPVAKFDDFRKAVARLGEPRRSTLDSEDITDRYHDMQAEITNLQASEKALRELLDDKNRVGSLKDHLDVRRELSSVRGQIDQRKGQIQRWDKETAFATLRLTMQDRKGYVPPTSPDFGTSIGRTWASSIDALVWTGKGLVLTAVAVAPWLAVFAVVITPVVIAVRRRRRGAAPVEVMEVQPAGDEPPPAA